MNRLCSIAALIAFVLVPGATLAQEKSSSQQVIRFGVGVDPAFSPIYYAKQEKLFEAAGLNVEVLLLAQAADAMDGVIAGQNPVAGGSETTAITRAGRGDLRAIAVFGQSSTFIKLVVRDGIKDVNQIKSLGVVPGSASEFVSGKLLEKYNIDREAINWVRGAPPEFPALLARGDVDGYFLWEPWPTNGVKVGGKILMNSGDVGYGYNMLLTVDGGWLDANKAAAKALVQALAKACEAISEDQEKAAIATQAATKIPLETARKLLQDVSCVVRDFTAEDRAVYKEVAQFLVRANRTPKLVDVESMLQTGFVPESR